VTNNNGFWIWWSGLLALLYNYNQLWQLTINDCLWLAPALSGPRASSLPLWRMTNEQFLLTLWAGLKDFCLKNLSEAGIEITILNSSSVLLCCHGNAFVNIRCCLANGHFPSHYFYLVTLHYNRYFIWISNRIFFWLIYGRTQSPEDGVVISQPYKRYSEIYYALHISAHFTLAILSVIFRTEQSESRV
jgi:hypothetical protein